MNNILTPLFAELVSYQQDFKSEKISNSQEIVNYLTKNYFWYIFLVLLICSKLSIKSDSLSISIAFLVFSISLVKKKILWMVFNLKAKISLEINRCLK